MLSDFKKHIQHEKLFFPGEKILLTVSGGIDSIVMCELFHQAKINFGIAHCNFQLRDKESDEDEIFVEELAEKYNVPFHTISFETSAYAKKNKLSIQAAARELRYNWFEEIRKQFNYNFIATAHHRDDSVETFFINLVRGTGISGLHGILPKHGKIIRPLLFTSKNVINIFAKANKLKHREDSSNSSEKYLRNKIRKRLIPLLKEMNPSIEATMLTNMKHVGDVEFIFNEKMIALQKKIIKKSKTGISISIKKLKKLEPLPTYLFELLKKYDFNFSTIEEIAASLDGTSGKKFLSSTHRLVKDRDLLIVEALINKKLKAEEGSTIKVNETTKKIILEENKLTFKKQKLTPLFKFPTENKIAAIDFNKLKFPLELRKWKNGDTFQPLGMKGKKKLSDFFIDQKFSIPEKENTWLLLSEGRIVWVVGHRLDDRFKITPKTTSIYFASLI